MARLLVERGPENESFGAGLPKWKSVLWHRWPRPNLVSKQLIDVRKAGGLGNALRLGVWLSGERSRAARRRCLSSARVSDPAGCGAAAIARR
jgi:hypothetical protein